MLDMHIRDLPLSAETRALRLKRRQAERQYRKDPTQRNWTAYTQLRNRVLRMLKKDRQQNYVKKLSDAETSRDFYRIVNNLLNRKSAYLPDEFKGSDFALANEFQSYFREKIERIQEELSSSGSQTSRVQSVHGNERISKLRAFRPVSEEDVLRTIATVKSKSSELDPCPATVWKHCAHVFAPYLRGIFNNFLTSGKFPKTFKEGLLKPMIKKKNSDKESLSNYRPVCNLHFLSKLLERIVDAQLNEHMDKNRLHPPYQSAYRQNHSVETALLHVHDEIMRCLDQGEVCVLVMLDQTAAFDLVRHDNLLRVLSDEFGVSGDALA